MGLYNIYGNGIKVFIYDALENLYPEGNIQFIGESIKLYAGAILLELIDAPLRLQLAIINTSSGEEKRIDMDIMALANNRKHTSELIESDVKPIIDKYILEIEDRFEQLENALYQETIDMDIEYTITKIDSSWAKIYRKTKDDEMTFKFNYLNKSVDALVKELISKMI